MKRTKKGAALSAAVCGAAVSLTALGGAAGAAQNTPLAAHAERPFLGGGMTLDGIKWPVYNGNVTLTVWSWSNPPQPDKVVPAFEKAYPNIKIKLENVGAGTAEYTKLAAANTAGSGEPDVVMLEFPYIPEFASSHAIVSISSYVDQYKGLVPKWAWEQSSYKGGVYMVPFGGGTMSLVYRPDVLAKYKLPVPTTWSTFASDAVALHKSNPSEYLTYFPNNDGEYINALMAQAGAVPTGQKSNGSWVIDMTSPAIENVWDLWTKLVKEGAVPLYSDFEPAWEHAVGTGTFASYLAADWEPNYVMTSFLKPGSQTFTVTQMPQWTAGEHVDANWGGSGYAVTSQSKNQRAGALFAAFMDLGAINASMEEGGGLPTVNTAQNYPEFQMGGDIKGFTEKNLNVVYQSYQPDVVYPPFSPWSTVIASDMETEFEAVVAGKETVNQALTSVQNQVASFAQSEGYQITTG